MRKKMFLCSKIIEFVWIRFVFDFITEIIVIICDLIRAYFKI